MASYQDGSPLEFCHGHKREQSQDSGAYIDWNSEDSASPVGNPDNTLTEDFVTVVAVENDGGEAKKDAAAAAAASSFVTILAIGESESDSGKSPESDKEEEVLLYRLPGERLGFGLKFEGGTNTAENVKRLFIQSSAPDSPASRAKCSWGSLVEGDEILKIDGHLVNNMTRLDCVRCLKESSVVIKLYVRHKSQKANQQPNRIKVENADEGRANGASSSPMVVSAEMKKTVPPPPPVPPRKITRKSPVPASKEEPTVVGPPDGFCDLLNAHNPVPKVRNVQGAPEETAKNLSKFVIRVPQKGGHDSPDLAKRMVKRNGPDLKLIPPEPKVYLDLLAQEESRNGESESDDTSSTISTVVGLSSIPNTTNSSFSDLRSSASSFCDSTNPSTPTSEPTTPVLDLSRMLSPYEHTDNNEFLFSKLINGKDQDNLSYEEKTSACTDDMVPLQPPLSFQDAPLSYGNEEMRANLTENMGALQEETFSNGLKNTEDAVDKSEPSFDGKCKESHSKPAVPSKKPSLIPRLAKSIGLLSPPKPSPRKESGTDGNKSRFNKKKPPPLPPPADAVQNAASESAEGKTLKSSIPYLKKKKMKSDDSKKNSKADKSKPSNASEEGSRGNSSLLPNDSRSQNHETEARKAVEAPKTAENEAKLTWEVPDLKNSKGNTLDGDVNGPKNGFGGSEGDGLSISEPEGFLSGLESGEFKTTAGPAGSCEPHFLFPWTGSKHLETIGEDEEDLSVDEAPDRYTNGDRRREDKSLIKIVEEMEFDVPAEDGNFAGETSAASKDNEGSPAEGSESCEAVHKAEESQEKPEERPAEIDTVLEEQENESEEKGREDLGVKEDESEASRPSHKNALCNNHVLVKLDNDSLEVVKNVGLTASNGEIKEVMVPVVSAIGLAPTPSFTRMPPDGHEVPQNYADESLSDGPVTGKSQMESRPQGCDPGLPPLPESDPPTTPSARCSLLYGGREPDGNQPAGRTNRDSAAAKPARNSFWRQDEKSEKSVRDKIAMFSSVPDGGESSAAGPGKLSKYKSSDDVFFYDDADCNRNLQNGKFFSRSILSLDKESHGGSPFAKKSSYCVSATAPRSLDYSNRTQSSMDLTSSSSAYSSSCSPDSSLSSNSSYLGYSSTLPRKKTREDNRGDSTKKDVGVNRATSFSIHGRSQSLLDVTPSPYKTRYLSESSQEDGQKPGSLNLLMEQRRKNLSKLRGLVIPEKLSDTVPNQPIVDLPEIKSRDLILNSKVPNAYKEKIKTNPKWNQTTAAESSAPPKVTPTHLWDMQSKTPNIPKYSPAFKRKSISVFGGKEPLCSKKEIQSSLLEPVKPPVKPPRNLPSSRQSFSSEDRKYQDSVNSSDGESPYGPEKGQRLGDSPRSTEMYVPKRKSTPLGKYRLHGDSGRSEEDSDNDSAVSSSRSSISHGFSPPASPLLDGQYQGVDDSGHRSSLLLSPERSPLIRTLSSETTVSVVSNTSTLTSGSQASISSNDASSSSDANNKRILKPQSVEAINRKNVLTSAKYSRGFDVKAGSPLIQRKFLGEALQDNERDVKESGLPRVAEPLPVGESFYPGRKYSANSIPPSAKTEPLGKSHGISKIAYITDVVDVTDVPGKKRLEKSESLPSAPTLPAVQPAASRKTSVPFGFSWENGNNWDQSNKKQMEVSKDNYVPVCLKDSRDMSAKVSSADRPAGKSLAADKDLDYSCARLKNDKSPVETDSSLSSKNPPNESVIDKMKNSKIEPKGAQVIADKVTNGGRRSVSVNDIRKAFEKVEASAPAPGRVAGGKAANLTTAYCGLNGNHVRVSSLDSTNSEDSCALAQGQYGFPSNLQREQFGSITSLASSTSLISPQELQLLIEEANQTLEESGSGAGGSSPNNHDVLVIILHRDTVGGSVGITLAGGADYESKEITVHKVLAGSPADRDGRIQKGDRILSINGKSMKGVTHRESLAILKSPRLEVVLVVSRLKADANPESVNPDDAVPATTRHSFLSGSSRPPRILEGSTLNESDESKASEIPRGPPVVLSLIKDGAGLGFSLEGGKDCPTGDRPLVIKKIFTGGAAEKCGHLKAGDEIVNVNGIDVSVMSRIEVWKLMKQLPDGNVTITVKHEVENRSAVQA